MTANKLLALADDYSRIAFEYLSLANCHREEDLDRTVEVLRINFLFPGVGDRARAFLIAAWYARRSEVLGMGTERRSPGILPPEALATSTAIRAEVVKFIRSSQFVHALTPLQTEILESEYLSLRDY